MDVEAFEQVRELLPDAFSEQHATLVKICFGAIRPDPSKIEPVANERCLQRNDMDRLYDMVLVEFLTSLEKEKSGSDETRPKADPNPYDVFLMETTMDRPTKHIAVCVPVRWRRELAWYNGGKELIPLRDLTPKWRVASLSGPARVLAALSEPPNLLTTMAMERKMIADAAEDTGILDSFSMDQDWKERIGMLNESQQAALATVVSPSFKKGFFPIQGPPGTGKTSVLVASIAAIGKEILVVAPSNAAVANVAIKTFETGLFGWHEISVYGENTDPIAHFLNPKIRGERFVNVLLQHETAEGNAEKQDRIRRDLIEWLRLGEEAKDRTLTELGQFCPHYNMESRVGRESLCEQLRESKVVFATLNSAGSPMLTRNLKVNTLMLDEGGQTPEAEFFIATQFPGVAKMVVVGDPMQLPATVIDLDCKRCGYGTSWLEKVYRFQPEKVHLLDTQYRMDPKILQFPNRTFYRDRIISGDNVHSREPFVAKPFLFIDTSRRGSEEREAFSWKNAYEGIVIRSLLFHDPDIQRLLQDPRPARIIVITPYSGQVKLLKETLTCPRGCVLDVATVDSFQGQEADILILSTVRTRKIGFVDDRQRLNVALTRAKRVLRVVGDASFFGSFRTVSTLRRLFEFAKADGALEETVVGPVAWARPNWSDSTLWKPVANVRFYECLKKMIDQDRNVCFNTLHAIATPDLHILGSRIPAQRDIVSWYTSYLKGHGDSLRIVWLAKEGRDQPIIEAHYAGTQAECNRFVQVNCNIPPEARAVEPTLSGIITPRHQPGYDGDAVSLAMNQPFVAWPFTNSVQNAICTGTELPQGGVQLDRCQEEVAKAKPPLIVESRSGTGKTLALLQHAAYHADTFDERSALFVTVSPRLRRQLHQKFEELNDAANLQLPPTSFYCFGAFIDKLVTYCGVGSSFAGKDKCRFLAYVESRTSHHASATDALLVENEIAGVISGSVTAAQQGAPLSRSQYLATKRSNIGNKTDAGRADRNRVYDEYERYVVWKRETSKFDMNDVVLRLLQVNDWPVLFSAAYLDEIQDLSYAAIFLICSIAGKDSLRWVCAGDTAQMVSPGCSFTFAGLKETLLAVREGIESKLSKVTQLLVNYRTTRDVLILGNEILSVAKREFPGAIGFAKPESAIKDLGIKVVLCDWEECFSQSGIKLGRNQALIYSCDDQVPFEKSATDWIGSHPFILSALDSKGLEFDDVIVAFDLGDRKTWNVASKKVASLRMLRELYVAVTRAQRRVVILVKNSDSAMKKFFNDTLTYDFQETRGDLIRIEFDKETTAEMWRQKGRELFEDEQYVTASRCFDSAGDRGWSAYANGRHLHGYGNKPSAITAYHAAFSEFFASGEYELSLDVALLLTKFASWNVRDNTKLDLAIRTCPDYLDRNDVVRLNLLCNRWDDIDSEDLKEGFLSDILVLYRTHPRLVRLVQQASNEDRADMGATIPVVVGDYHARIGAVDSAVRLYIQAADGESAEKLTLVSLKTVQSTGNGQAALSKCISFWTSSRMKPAHRTLSLLLQLFQSPTKAAKTNADDCLAVLGRTVIIESVDHAKLDRTVLYEFSASEFIIEVTRTLESQYSRNQVEVVRWFALRKDKSHAVQFAKKRLSKWTVKEVCSIALILGEPDDWIVREIHKRKIVSWYMLALMGTNTVQSEKKSEYAGKFVSTKLRPLVDRDQSLLNLVRELFRGKQPLDDETIISKVKESVWRYPWTDTSVVKLAQTLRNLAQINKTVDPIGFIEFPVQYRGIFQQAARTSDLLVQTIKASPEKDQPWLLRAFATHKIAVERLIQTDLALDFLVLALKAELYELALEFSWKLTASPVSAQANLSAVTHCWNVREDHREWLSNRFRWPGDDAWQVVLVAHPRVGTGHDPTSRIRRYGPAITRYLGVNGNRVHNPALCQRLVDHEEQLRARLEEIKITVQSSSTTRTFKKKPNKNKKKKRKNKKKAANAKN